MAKKDKPDTKGKKAKSEEKDEPETFKYGVGDIAEKLDIAEASVRVKLRNAGVEKAGKSYGWNTKSELQEVIDEITSEKPAKKADKKADTKGKKSKKSSDDDDDEDEAPKKAAKGKKAAKPSKGKKSKSDDDDDDDD